MVMTALFFVTLCLSDLFYNLQYQSASRLCGNAELSITGDVFSQSMLEEFSEKYSEEIEYVDTFTELTGLLKNDEEEGTEQVILLEITDLAVFADRHADRLRYYDGISSDFRYSYPEVWMAKDFARQNAVSVGDTIEIYLSLYGKYQYFTVTYLFEEEGIFANTSVNNVLIDVSAIGDRGLINTAFIKLSEPSNKEEIVSALQSHLNNPELLIGDAVDYEKINRVVSDNNHLVSVVFIFVLALVVFILITSYLLVFQKRTKELFLFKAMGASIAQNILLLLFEGSVYGFIGAVLGTVLGRFGLSIVSSTVLHNYTDAVVYSIPMYIESLLLGIGISCVSCFYPSVKLSFQTQSRARKTEVHLPKKRDIVILPLLAVLLIGLIILMRYFENETLLLSILFLLAVSVFIYKVTPYLLQAVSFLFSYPKGITFLSSVSVKRSKIGSKLAAMLGAVIAFSYIAIGIVSIVANAVIPYQNHFRGDFVVQSISEFSDLAQVNQRIASTYGVKSSYYYTYQEFETSTPDKEISYYVFTVENKESLDNVTQGVTEEQKMNFANVDNAAVVSYDMANRFGKKIGDTITLSMGDYGVREFVIVGIDTTVTQTDRVVFLFASDTYRFEEKFIFVNTDKNVSNYDLYKDLRSSLADESCYVLYFNDWANGTTVGLNGITTLLRLLQILIGIVSLIGIFNLTLSSFYERSRELDTFFASGMDGTKKRRLHFSEGLILAGSGGILGLLFGFAANFLLPVFGKIIDRYSDFSYFPTSLPVVTVSVMVVYVLAYVILSTFPKKKIERNIL